MQCRGVTQTGSACRMSAIGSDCYCSRHVLSKEPTAPTAVGWPSSKGLVRWVSARPSNWIQTNVPTGDVASLRTDQFLMLTLVLLRNRHLADESQGLIDACVDHMSQFPHLSQYREYFARELSRRHREAARARLVAFYFRRVDGLCNDVVDTILASAH